MISVSVRRFLLETEIIEPKSGGSAFQEDKTSSAKTIKQEYARLVQENSEKDTSWNVNEGRSIGREVQRGKWGPNHVGFYRSRR